MYFRIPIQIIKNLMLTPFAICYQGLVNEGSKVPVEIGWGLLLIWFFVARQFPLMWSCHMQMNHHITVTITITIAIPSWLLILLIPISTLVHCIPCLAYPISIVVGLH